MAKYLLSALLTVLVLSGNSYSEIEHDKILSRLKDIDAEINELTISLRENEVGWGLEILTSNQTNDFQQSYLKVKNRLDPVITFAIQNVREKVTKLRTLGQTLSSIPELVSDMLTIVDYETRLNHIEFLIVSRRTTISARRSIIIASVFGLFGLCLGILSARRNANIRRAFKEIDRQHIEILSVLQRSQRVSLRRSWLRRKNRRLPSKKPCRSSMSALRQAQGGEQSQTTGLLDKKNCQPPFG